ncbi:DUF624 domain-containing protein [Sediminibacillus dalangtanensis]|uniref:DUF624 domain-containing protein n=1 Tax=Sediminibacillus dalangtanensis TaxID=2729421 RepID=A0ABX7VMN5_9BACI|nr:YesL family protein [Sediminibacillus dalangtanensis]QTM98046.1 DUF624 domain-containing protein [Sediminibacillus dalangtanensis]
MNAKTVVTTLDTILNWITKLALLNFLWILYTFKGLIIGGVFPATAAAMGIVRKWLRGERDLKTWQTFDQFFRIEFKNANVLGWILAAFGMLLYLNYQVIASSSDELFFVIPFAFYFVLFLYSLVVIWSFPLLIHYQTKVYQYIKNALIIGLTKLHISVSVAVLMFVLLYVSVDYPSIIPFFLFSLGALAWLWPTLPILMKLDAKLSGK